MEEDVKEEIEEEEVKEEQEAPKIRKSKRLAKGKARVISPKVQRRSEIFHNWMSA